MDKDASGKADRLTDGTQAIQRKKDTKSNLRPLANQIRLASEDAPRPHRTHEGRFDCSSSSHRVSFTLRKKINVASSGLVKPLLQEAEVKKTLLAPRLNCLERLLRPWDSTEALSQSSAASAVYGKPDSSTAPRAEREPRQPFSWSCSRSA